MEILLDSIIQRNEEVIHSDMDGETVMMDMDQGKYFGLDKIATRIWDLLTEAMSVEKICQQLSSEYNISEEDCYKDVVIFLDEMVQNQVVSVSN